MVRWTIEWSYACVCWRCLGPMNSISSLQIPKIWQRWSVDEKFLSVTVALLGNTQEKGLRRWFLSHLGVQVSFTKKPVTFLPMISMVPKNTARSFAHVWKKNTSLSLCDWCPPCSLGQSQAWCQSPWWSRSFHGPAEIHTAMKRHSNVSLSGWRKKALNEELLGSSVT